MAPLTVSFIMGARLSARRRWQVGGGPSSPVRANVNSAARVKWQGPAQAKIGDLVVLQLTMESAEPVLSFPLAVGFDPKLLAVVGVAEGDF